MTRRAFLFVVFISVLPCQVFGQYAVSWDTSTGGNQRNYVADMIQTGDGGYLTVGYSELSTNGAGGIYGGLDGYVVKFRSDGTVDWQKAFGGTDDEIFYAITPTRDGNYLLAGHSESSDGDLTGNNGDKDFWVVKMTETGTLIWQRNFGSSLLDEARGVVELATGEIIVTGTAGRRDGDVTPTPGGVYSNSTFWIIKLAGDGTLLQDRSYGNVGIQRVGLASPTSDGGVFVAGSTGFARDDVSAVYGREDIWVIKIDKDLVLQWDKNYGGSQQEGAAGIMTTSDGGFLVYGGSASSDIDATSNRGGTDMFVVKADASGNLEWSNTYGGSNQDSAWDMVPSVRGGYLISGHTQSSDGQISVRFNTGSNAWIIKISDTGNLEEDYTVGGRGGEILTSIIENNNDAFTICSNASFFPGGTGNRTAPKVGSPDIWLARVSLCGTDTQAPKFTCPINQTLSCGAAIPDYISSLAVTDDCSTTINLTQSPGAGSAFYDGILVTITATDLSGNKSECTFPIAASTADTQPPVFACPVGETLDCGDPLPDYVARGLPITDNCSGTVTYVQTPAPGTPFYDGLSVSLVITDGSGNSSNCSFSIGMSTPDVAAPAITCPADQLVACGATLPNYTSLASANDACDIDPVVSQLPAPGSLVTNGMTVTLTATDASGNSSSCNFKVNFVSDAVPPVITCLSDQTLACGSTLPDYTLLAGVTDDCDAGPVVSQLPVPGSHVTDGMTVTLTATDASGNSSNCSFKINFGVDMVPPVITCPIDQVVACGSLLPDYKSLAGVTDNCDASPLISQLPAPGSVVTDGMTVTLTATDASGNDSNCSLTVGIQTDVQAPDIICIPAFEAACGEVLEDYTGQVTASDNCSSTVTVTQSPMAGTVVNEDTEVIFTVTDGSGNRSVCSVQVEVAEPEIDAGDDVTITRGERHRLVATVSEQGSILWSPSAGLDDPAAASPGARPQATTTYSVRLITGRGCEAEDFVTITVEEPMTRYGFSPDNDGINDEWVITGIEKYPDNVVSIYNRWGNLVYEINGYDNRTRVFRGFANRLGSLGADRLPEGTYYFHINVPSGHDLEKVDGFLILKR